MNSFLFSCALCFAAAAVGCDYVDTPYTYVAVDNAYPADDASAGAPSVVYEAYWEGTLFASPLLPGASSGPQATVPCSDNTAWAVLAPGWDPSSPTPPTSFVVLESRSGFGVALNDTLTIPVGDATFAGNCAAGSPLSQAEADLITQQVFRCTFAGLHYDAATCTTTALSGDAGADDGCGE